MTRIVALSRIPPLFAHHDWIASFALFLLFSVRPMFAVVLSTSGTSFTPITYASHGATTFATTNLDPAFVKTPTYNPTNVTLVAL